MGRMMWLCLVCGLSTTPTQAFPQFGAENAAMAVLDAFMMAFNARDDEAMCQTFHYPNQKEVGSNQGTHKTYSNYKQN